VYTYIYIFGVLERRADSTPRTRGSQCFFVASTAAADLSVINPSGGRLGRFFHDDDDVNIITRCSFRWAVRRAKKKYISSAAAMETCSGRRFMSPRTFAPQRDPRHYGHNVDL